MELPTPHALLEAWERGSGASPILRGLCLLKAIEPDRSLEELAGLSLVERDERIRQMRRALVGARYEALASCPACSESVELAFSDSELPAWTGVKAVDGARIPTSLDLLEVMGLPAPDRPGALRARCGENDDALESVGGVFDLQIDLTCPACGETWQEPFDIAHYFWIELSAYCGRILGEVHTLARAYGWTEGQVLALSPMRRAHYLRMVAHG